MISQVETEQDTSVSKLVGGIVEDGRELFVEQMTLFQVEMKNHLHSMVTAFIPLGIGIAVALIALFLLGAGAAHFVAWQWPNLPLWAGYCLVGSTVAVIALALLFWAKSMFDRVSLTPDTALKGLKENLQWKTNK